MAVTVDTDIQMTRDKKSLIDTEWSIIKQQVVNPAKFLFKLSKLRDFLECQRYY